MINKNIEVTVYRTKTTKFSELLGRNTYVFGPFTTNFDDVKNAEDYFEGKVTFSKFTDKGKVSKSDESYKYWNGRFVEEAERAFQSQLALEADTEADMKRALELKAIIDNANFDSELVSIKTKYSKSKWYERDGFFNMRSYYDYKVPVSVKDEALELLSIRRKHQGNKAFDFNATSYRTIVVRTADHDKY